ncbi:hypothetical protein B0J17DRAFT_629899 [Rhizoctonia solani]|nr:hypothetical protein B0J17DRAFT_629899 [Rhizoctonia solani]
MTSVLDNTFGATLIGVMLATFTYGIATIQLYGYLNTHRDSSRMTHFYVSNRVGALGFDTLKVICICHMQYYYTISNFGKFPALLSTTWSLSHLPKACCMHDHGDHIHGSVFRCPAYVKLRKTCAIVSNATKSHKSDRCNDSRIWLGINSAGVGSQGIGWLGSVAVCDILLVCSLTTVLATQRTGFKRTDILINRIILLTINTGLLTSMPNLIHFIPNFLLGTPRGKGGGTKDIEKTGSQARVRVSNNINVAFFWGVELVRVQIDREICAHGSSLSVGKSRLSGDEDGIKCYDAGDKLHPLP